jgi:hypothetical protein
VCGSLLFSSFLLRLPAPRLNRCAFLFLLQRIVHLGVKFPLGTDPGSPSPPQIIKLTISQGNAKLTQDQCLGATSPYTECITCRLERVSLLHGAEMHVSEFT